ncbi:hypothetical protein TVAG_115370 [Trichomonas vaginalis G3]|uniref:Uncharacterized protein n=1 Tax=Trichomonas vaginalis (strain ATCC PRA-98 / G3) TaxID=412133 RepID=A2F7H5_TRIV3|nr:hypothetical protein TVAGG3_0179730 [Trichomonas vaginalis G3]EAX99133.1 hypothetical protein TVAG_115370 [Trichomonas vaginalis G3]KAI5549195.1 hypothetical protein TVAGG3_0179730 [Trichomonas vaginalis G3]|eukprot:XP_001312063.1 hypothetical protein [Trichomonas vaginalis G3]
MELREPFRSNTKNLGDAMALMNLKRCVAEKLQKYTVQNFNTEEKATFILLRTDIGSNNTYDNTPDIDGVVSFIININNKLFNDLNPEVININQIDFLHYLAKKNQNNFKSLFMSILKEISGFYKEAPSFFTSLRDKIPELNQYITQSREMIQLFLYKCFRFVEDSQYISISKGISKKESTLEESASAKMFIIKILPRTSADQMTREFLRFKISDLLTDNNITMPQHFTEDVLLAPAAPGVTQCFISSNCERILLSNGGNITTLLSELGKDLRTGFMCDCIRWALNSSNFEDSKALAAFILNMLQRSDNNIEVLSIMISLSLEFLTFQAGNHQDDVICHSMLRVLKASKNLNQSSFLDFIESITLDNPKFSEGLSQAQLLVNKKFKFKNLVLPEPSAQAVQIDVKKELSIIQNKLKWNRHSLDLSGLVTQLEPFLGKLQFNLPPNNDDENLNLILSSDIRIITQLSIAYPNLLRYYIIFNPSNTNEIIEIMKQMIDEKSKIVVGIISTMIPFVPEIVDVIPGIANLLEQKCDLSEIIKISSHHCTIEEIGRMMAVPFFSPPGERTVQLFKASSEWHRVAQTGFWAITSLAMDVNHKNYIFSAILESAIHFTNIGRVCVAQIFSASQASQENFKIVAHLANKSDSWRMICMKIIKNWASWDSKALTKSIQQEKDSTIIIKTILEADKELSSKLSSLFGLA